MWVSIALVLRFPDQDGRHHSVEEVPQKGWGVTLGSQDCRSVPHHVPALLLIITQTIWRVDLTPEVVGHNLIKPLGKVLNVRLLGAGQRFVVGPDDSERLQTQDPAKWPVMAFSFQPEQVLQSSPVSAQTPKPLPGRHGSSPGNP